MEEKELISWWKFGRRMLIYKAYKWNCKGYLCLSKGQQFFAENANSKANGKDTGVSALCHQICFAIHRTQYFHDRYALADVRSTKGRWIFLIINGLNGVKRKPIDYPVPHRTWRLLNTAGICTACDVFSLAEDPTTGRIVNWLTFDRAE